MQDRGWAREEGTEKGHIGEQRGGLLWESCSTVLGKDMSKAICKGSGNPPTQPPSWGRGPCWVSGLLLPLGRLCTIQSRGVWGGDLQCTVAQVLLPIFPTYHILIFGSEVLVAFGCKPEMLVGVACEGDPV